MAWLTAPAPIACTSACLFSRITPAIAPATAEVRELAETLMMSMLASHAGCMGLSQWRYGVPGASQAASCLEICPEHRFRLVLQILLAITPSFQDAYAATRAAFPVVLVMGLTNQWGPPYCLEPRSGWFPTRRPGSCIVSGGDRKHVRRGRRAG